MTDHVSRFTVYCLLLTVLSACRLLGGNNPAGAYGVERESAVFLSGGQPLTLDPALTHGGPGGALGHIFSGLVTLDPELQLQPDLASGWEISADGTVYTFYVWQGATFHDGRPVTAEDVVFSWERATDPALGSDTAATYLGDIVGVREKLNGEAERISGLRVIDEHTLEVRIDAPKPYFLAKLTYPVAFVVDREQVDEPGWQREPNGAGPFRLLAWEDDQLMVLARFDDWYRPPAAIEHVVYLLGAGLPLAQYETGEIDVVGIGGGNLARMQDPNNPLSDELVTGVSMCTSTIGMNNEAPPFDDVRVRQAFNYALDKEQLIDAIWQGNSLVANGPLPPAMPGYTLREPTYPYDPERARALLAEAGYDDGLPPLTFHTSGYGDPGVLVTAAATMWQEALGADIQVVLLDPFIYYDELYAGNTGHLFSSGWCADYPDPQNFLDILYHSNSVQNLPDYHNPTVDALLEQARVEQDTKARLALYQQIEAMIIADAPDVFINHDLMAALVKPYLVGYELTPIGVPMWHRIHLER